MIPRVLIVAGSDSGGGAGIQADIKTCAALGAYAATAVTAVTVQDTTGVQAVHPVPPDLVAGQIGAVLGDIGADAVKIGMLGSAQTAAVVADALSGFAGPVVLDPVLVATSGDVLGDEAVVGIILDALMPGAAVVTPNRDELAILSGAAAWTLAETEAAARTLLGLGARAVLAKGGHAEGRTVTDLLVTRAGTRRYEHARQDTRHTHGTGCTLASAVASGLASDMDLQTAAARAVAYVDAAIRHAPGLGRGHGPLLHDLRERPDGWFPARSVRP